MSDDDYDEAAIRAELARRQRQTAPGEHPDLGDICAEIGVRFGADLAAVDTDVAVELARRARAFDQGQADPMMATARAVGALAAAFAELAAAVVTLAGRETVKVIERDEQGNISRIVEAPAG